MADTITEKPTEVIRQPLPRDEKAWTLRSGPYGGGRISLGTEQGCVLVETPVSPTLQPHVFPEDALVVLDIPDSSHPDNGRKQGIPALKIFWSPEYQPDEHTGQPVFRPQNVGWQVIGVNRERFGEYNKDASVATRYALDNWARAIIHEALPLLDRALGVSDGLTGENVPDFGGKSLGELRTVLGNLREEDFRGL